MSNGITSALFVALLALAACDVEAPSPEARPARTLVGAEPPSMRQKVDPARNRTWLLTEAGLFVHDAANPQKTEIVLPGWLWVRPQFACLPDVALGPRGEALVTSNVEATLWKIDPDSLAVSVHRLALDSDLDRDVGFIALAYSPEHGEFFAASASHGSLWRIDPLLRRAQRIPFAGAVGNICELGLRPELLSKLAAGGG